MAGVSRWWRVNFLRAPSNGWVSVLFRTRVANRFLYGREREGGKFFWREGKKREKKRVWKDSHISYSIDGSRIQKRHISNASGIFIRTIYKYFNPSYLLPRVTTTDSVLYNATACTTEIKPLAHKYQPYYRIIVPTPTPCSWLPRTCGEINSDKLILR